MPSGDGDNMSKNMTKQKTKDLPKPKETRPMTPQEAWNSKSFSIPNAIMQDNRQVDNSIFSEDEFRKIMAANRIKEEVKNKYKRTFQYF